MKKTKTLMCNRHYVFFMVKLVIFLEDLVYFFVMKRQENNLIKLNKIKKNNNKVSHVITSHKFVTHIRLIQN